MKRNEIRGGGTAFPAAPRIPLRSMRGYQGDFIDRRAWKQKPGSGVLDEQRPNRGM